MFVLRAHYHFQEICYFKWKIECGTHPIINVLVLLGRHKSDTRKLTTPGFMDTQDMFVDTVKSLGGG